MVIRRLLLVALLVPSLALSAAHTRAAGTNRFVVPTTDGPVVQTGCTSILNFCSLREALAAAADGDTIQFHPQTTGTILLDPTQGALQVTHAVTIAGPGAAVLAVDGGANAGRGTAVPVFVIGVLLTVTISGLTIQNGFNTETGALGAGGGGIAGPFSILTISNCVVRGNTAFANGGGIYANGLTLTNSTVSDNTTNGVGGGIGVVAEGSVTVRDSTLRHNIAADGGGLYNAGTTTIASSTITDNIAQGSGGGLDVVQATITGTTLTGNRVIGGPGGAIYARHGDAGYADVVASTITGNTADGAGQRGGGIARDLALGASVQLTGTIVAGNSAINGASAPDLSASGTSHGYNLIGDGTGATLVAAPGAGPDRIGTAAAPLNAGFDPRDLRDNGGATPTVALLPNSPAIDAGGGCPATDQRGQPRIGNCDVGAYEYQPVTPTVAGSAAPLGGGPIIFHGTGFQTGSRLTVGATTVTATSTDVSADGTLLTLPVPAHAAGAAAFTVTNPGSGHVATGTLTYTAPTPLPAPAPAPGGTGKPASLPGSRPAGPSSPSGSPNPLLTGR
jgi:predicted outer membrane repeat protein